MNPNDLDSAPNIGPKLASGLRQVGIDSLADLRALTAHVNARGSQE